MQYHTVESSKTTVSQFQSLPQLAFGKEAFAVGRSRHPSVVLNVMVQNDAKAGITIQYGIHATPFGEVLIATTPNGICSLHFMEAEEDAEPLLRLKWHKATMTQNFTATQALCDRIFASAATTDQKPFPLCVQGTDFQIQVWRALLSIPFGQVTTYQAIATAIGKPTATRAVGSAIGRNPIAYLIPCHRVIRESGALGGYYWGLERKAALLSWEANFLNF